MKVMPVLTCGRCRQPSRPFPVEVMDGRRDIQPEAPFTGRLACKCTKCARIFCACCCHPAALVEEMLRPGRFGLPEEFSGPHPKAAGPDCRAQVEPYDTIAAESEEEPAFDWNKPVTPGRCRVLGALYTSIATYCFMGAAGSACLWVVFSKQGRREASG